MTDDKETRRVRGSRTDGRTEKLAQDRKTAIVTRPGDASGAAEPLSVVENTETGDRFVLYTTSKGIEFQLRFENEEPWATQKQLADLFGRDVTVIRRHIKAIFSDGELDEGSVSAKTALTAADGKVYNTSIYSLDVILAVGYRVGSREAMLFRRWATFILRQYLLHGFVVDVPRLEAPGNRPDHFDDLLAKVRHIRSSEKRMWTRVLELASFCSDYGVMTEQDREAFFATIQNAMHWSVTQMTAAEAIHGRVDATKDNPGVVTFQGEMPTLAEAQVAKNFLAPNEIEVLNLVTSLTLEFFESQAEQRRPTTLSQFIEKMRDLLKLDGRPLIGATHRGSVSMAEAKRKASAELRGYKERIRVERENAGERALAMLAAEVRKRKRPAR